MTFIYFKIYQRNIERFKTLLSANKLYNYYLNVDIFQIGCKKPYYTIPELKQFFRVFLHYFKLVK